MQRSKIDSVADLLLVIEDIEAKPKQGISP